MKPRTLGQQTMLLEPQQQIQSCRNQSSKQQKGQVNK
jgi:hypothetical protein